MQHRQPHATLDIVSRQRKASKIAATIARYADIAGAQVLDIGTGSGVIAEYLSTIVGEGGRVVGVDRINQMQTDAVEFVPVSSTALPFDDTSFDIVITNHVIEHVGGRNDQRHHLREIARVLKPSGIVYLAMPNRWAPVEPHFRLPLLSWLPRGLRTPYVRVAGRGDTYDCDPMTRRELIGLLCGCGLEGNEVTMEVLRFMARNEFGPRLGKTILACPSIALKWSMTVVPTIVFLLAKAQTDRSLAKQS